MFFPNPKKFTLLSLFLFIILALRAFLIPFAHDEIATFFYYIQTSSFFPYHSHIYGNNHFLNSLLSWICYLIGGDHPLILRVPNLLAFILLCIAVYKFRPDLTSSSASFIIIIAFFLLSFRWISFFNMCRGYGLSIAFLVMAMACIWIYLNNPARKWILLFLISLQLALAANITLSIIVFILTILVLSFLLYKSTWTRDLLLPFLLHAALLIFWVKYSFFLQTNGNLDVGQSSQYWQTTFISLLEMLFGKLFSPFFLLIAIVFTAINFIAVFKIIRNKTTSLNSPSAIFLLLNTVCFWGLVISFLFLQKIFGVNYPEDRTALFFYVPAVFILAFSIPLIFPNFQKCISWGITIFMLVHFMLNLNFSRHPLFLYDTFPQRFYDRLLAEQNKASHPISIGGHRTRELLFGYMNYRHAAALNWMDAPENMLLNTDYAISLNKYRNEYEKWYEELDTDKNWGFTLLKRKDPITRSLLYSKTPGSISLNKETEYVNLFEFRDTTFGNDPLEVRLKFSISSGQMPAQQWLVLGVDSAEGKSLYYRRIPLNWMRKDWSGHQAELLLTTGKLPDRVHRLVCYIWNTKKQDLQMNMESVSLYSLRADGISVEIKR